MRVGQPVTGLGDTTVKLAGTSAISMGYRGSVAAMIRKVFPDVTGADPVERAIRAAVELLARHQILEDVLVGTGKARIRLRQVAPQAIEIRPAAATLHRCQACRAVQPASSPQDRCATFNCKGVMRPWNVDPDDYERRLASGTEPLVILAEEHSGQVPLEAREEIEAPVQGRRPEPAGVHYDPGARRRPRPAAVGDLAERAAPAQQLRPARRARRPPRGAGRPDRHVRRRDAA